MEMLQNGSTNNSTATGEFELVPPAKMEALIQVLESRLPKSAHLYNCALRLSRHPGEFEMYAFRGDLGPHAWILFKSSNQALGCGQLFGVSAPSLPSPVYVPAFVRQAFIDTPIINWDQQYEIVGLDTVVGALLTEIGTFVKGNVITSHPNLYYTMDREKALALEVPDLTSPSWVHLGPLEIGNYGNGSEWITNQWKYSSEGTRAYARTMIERHPSCGVYINGTLVSGVVTHADTMVGMLATEAGHRGRGHALLCMKAQLRALATEGYVPVSGVENRNEASKRFHEKLGMRLSHGTVNLNTIGF